MNEKKKRRKKEEQSVTWLKEKGAKTFQVLQRFFAKLNESMKLLQSERPKIVFEKVFQLLALKCGIGLMFPEKLLYSSSKAD